VAGLAPDDDGELALVVEFGGDGGVPDRIAMTDQAGRELANRMIRSGRSVLLSAIP
jgi:hypothetical protein